MNDKSIKNESRLSEIIEEAHEGCVLFSIDKDTYTSKLVQMNKAMRELIHADGDISHLKVLDVFGIDTKTYEEWIELLIDKRRNNEYCRILSMTGGYKRYITSFGLYEYEDGWLLNCTVNNKTDSDIIFGDIYSRYDLIINRLHAAIVFTNSELKIVEWSQGATELFGYRRDEAIGEKIIDLLVEEDLKVEIEEVADNIRNNNAYHTNNNITKSGNTITCEWYNNPVFDDEGVLIGIISLARDVSELKEIEQNLNDFDSVIRRDKTAVLLTDSKGFIEYANDAYSEMTGYSTEEVIGCRPSIVNSGSQPKEFFADLWKTISSDHIWEGNIRNQRKDGSYYIADTRIIPIKKNNGKIHRYACTQKDITKDLERNNYINDLSKTLENQERLSMIGQMAAGIIHEINNPLSFIDINVHALKDMIDEISESVEDKDMISELYELIDDLKDGINGIKEIASGLKRFTYKSQSSELENISLNEEINTVITISKNEYKYYADISFDQGEIDDIKADSGKIKQVILNLIINAVHAIRDNESEYGKIHIVTYQDDEYVTVEINDNGTGIPEEVRDKIFNSFFTTKKEGKGTGLGLSLSKKIIEQEHKGIIYFETEMGIGTTFYIKLRRDFDGMIEEGKEDEE